MTKTIQPTFNNEKIIAQVLADRIKTARSERYPSATQIIEELEVGK